MIVTIRFGKTGARTVHVLCGTHVPTCPVRAVLARIAEAGLTEGALFRSISKHGVIGPPARQGHQRDHRPRDGGR